MYYHELREGLSSKANFVPAGTLPEIDQNKDWYTSLFQYDAATKEQAETKGSVSGIKTTSTQRLLWDFDKEGNLEQARQDAVALCKKLTNNFPTASIRTYFSGNKGFNVEMDIQERLTPEQFKKVTSSLADDLSTYDGVVNDPVRVIRLPNTKHPKSGLYKVQLSTKALETRKMEEILNYAKTPQKLTTESNPVSIPAPLYIVEPKIVKNITTTNEMSPAPKGWKPYKWALADGFFESGERHNALMVIAATCRGLGYDKDTTYYMCKSALKKQAARTGTEEFDKSELWTNIIEQSVFTDNWQGGQYSPKNNPWLKKYCERMGFAIDKEEDTIIQINDVGRSFENFALNFEKNIIRTGISEIDNNVLFMTSTHNGILGQPGAGKTSLILQWLEQCSKNNELSVFASLDMGKPIIYGKMIQSELGVGFKQAVDIYKTDARKRLEIDAALAERFKNVIFTFKTGLTPADVKNFVNDTEQKMGRKVRFLATDYLERLSGPYSDATANSGFLSNQMLDIATEMELCSVMLLQTQKHSTSDISDPLLSMKQIKGSSLIEQSASVVMTLWREGYNPKTVDKDKYISFAAVKNRFGSLWSDDFSWNGVRGHISDISEEERESLDEFRQAKAEAKQAEKKDDWV